MNNGSKVQKQPEHVLMPLPEASEYLFGTKSRVSTLRTAIRNGQLKPARIAGTFFVTVKDLEEMNRKCREEQEDHISISEPERESNPATLSGTGKKKSPRDAALKKLETLKDNLQHTSPQNGSQTSPATVVSIVPRSS